MEAPRRPFPQLNTFRSWVRDELNSRRRTWPTPISAPFARMTSCNEDEKNRYKYFTLGLHGFDSQDLNLFDLTYGAARDIVGYAYRQENGVTKKVLIGADEISYVPPNMEKFTSLSNSDASRLAVNRRIDDTTTQQNMVANKGAHPIPGITSVQIQRSGLAAPLIATVHWQCYNQQQLEFLRNHFMIVGTYIVLEWGQQYHNRQLEKVLSFNDASVDTELLDSVIEGRGYVIDQFSKPNEGNYDFVVGQVGNFTIDFDAATNIYKCSTKVVSLGENVWGLGSKHTATVLSTDDVTVTNRISDVHSFFDGEGSPYSILLGNLEKGSKFTRPSDAPEYTTVEGQTTTAGHGGDDTAFISWEAFTVDVINGIIGMFANISTNQETQQMYDRLMKELSSLLGLGGPPRDSANQKQKELYDQEWVGNHSLLRSTDPGTIIVITPALAKDMDPTSEWLGGGTFGTTHNKSLTGAKLTEGVWLNAEMVRSAFLETTTLQSAIQLILSRINVAMGGYWQLQLFYDDELNVYKVIDYKFDHETKQLPFYAFNSQENDHHNETVDIKFDTAFPPELITQMMVVSMIQTTDPEKQQELFERYPLINNTSPFMFAVNWTTLKDILKNSIDAKRGSYNVFTSTSPNVNIADGGDTTISNSGRIVDDSHVGPNIGPTSAAANAVGTPRSVPGGAPAAPQAADASRVAPPPRDTVVPPPPQRPVPVLTHNPLSQMTITSKFGPRNAPIVGGSTDHKAIDLRASVGTPVYAAASGMVTISKVGSTGYGAWIEIKHDGITGPYTTRYAHLSELLVTAPKYVTGGQLIGKSGGAKSLGPALSGNSETPHLHFEVRVNGVAVDPEKSLPKNLLSPTISSTNEDTVDSTNAVPLKSPPTSYDKLQESNNVELYTQKFGSHIISLIYPTVSNLRSIITSDGYKNINDNMVNAFISPFPTKTSVEVKIPGLAGVSISDGFLVDKLPFIFANYGVFQVTEVSDEIAPNGWYTTIRGYFKMLWPSGTGPTRDDG